MGKVVQLFCDFKKKTKNQKPNKQKKTTVPIAIEVLLKIPYKE